MSLLSVTHLAKDFKGAHPLTDVSFEVDHGEVCCLIGPSGTGKSTLLRCLNRLEVPTAGTVVFDGHDMGDPKCDIRSVRQSMQMVFQTFNLFNNLNAIDNVATSPIRLLKTPKETAYREAQELLKRVGLPDKEQSFPEELSGGQLQRVAIARAIAMRPKMILFDEPTSALDPAMVEEVLTVMRDLAATDIAMLVVTHELSFAREVADKVLFLDQGTIVESGTADQVLEHPQTEACHRFVFSQDDVTFRVTHPTDPGAPATIIRLTRKANLDRESQLFVENAFEVLVLDVICGHIQAGGGTYPVTCTASFEREARRVRICASWQGDAFDPFSSADPLAQRLLSGMTSQDTHTYESGTNTVTCTVACT